MWSVTRRWLAATVATLALVGCGGTDGGTHDEPQTVQGKSCSEINNCVQHCNDGDSQCVSDWYNALMDCSSRNGCGRAQDYQACLQNHCPTELRRCARDG